MNTSAIHATRKVMQSPGWRIFYALAEGARDTVVYVCVNEFKCYRMCELASGYLCVWANGSILDMLAVGKS